MPVNWSDPTEIARDDRIYGASVLVLCGVAAWDVLSTAYFDLSIISKRRPWKWPMSLYFMCRISMLLHTFLLAVNLNTVTEIPCQQIIWVSKGAFLLSWLHFLIQWLPAADAIGTCGSSLILALRARAVWNQGDKGYEVTTILGILFLGQVALWVQIFRYPKTVWNSQRNVCAIVSTAPKAILVSVFAYTMAFDLIVLLLCVYKLSDSQKSSTLAHLMLRDGMGYFGAAFSANLVQTVMASLGLNPVLNIIALPFAQVVSVIAATTAFRQLFITYDGFFSGESTHWASIIGQEQNGGSQSRLTPGRIMGQVIRSEC